MKYYLKIFISVILGITTSLLIIKLTAIAIDSYNISVTKYNDSLLSYVCITFTITISIVIGRLCYSFLTKNKIDPDEYLIYKWIIIGSIISFLPALLDESLLLKKSSFPYHAVPWILILLIIFYCKRLYQINLSHLKGYSLWIISFKTNTHKLPLNLQLIVEAKNINDAENEIKENFFLYPKDPTDIAILSTRKINKEIYFKYLTIMPEAKNGILASFIL